MNLGYYSSYMEIDLGAIRNNCRMVLDGLQGRCKLIPVVKADAYNIGVQKVTELLTGEFGVDIVGLAQVYEGVEMRRMGFRDVEILIMGLAPVHTMPYAVEHDMQLNIFMKESAKALSDAVRAAGKSYAKIQIKLETGMHRLGVKPGAELEELLDYILSLGNLQIVGAFTHFATAAQLESPFTYEQYKLFKRGVEQIRARGIELQYVHCCNSGATIWLKEALEYCTHVRPGSIYMGYAQTDGGVIGPPVREPMSWRAFVSNVNLVQPGESVGYDRRFAPDKPTMVATVDIGYGDGLFRPLAIDGGPVLIGDQRARYVGCCMDNCFVDVTGIDCKPGDEVTVFGYSRGGALLSIFELERFTGQCYQTMLCGINDRVKRVYLD